MPQTTFVAAALSLLVAQQPAPPVAPVPQPSTTAAQAAPASPVPGDALQLQVMLDRAGFSPGPIDGRIGAVTRRALEAYQQQRGAEGAPAVEPLTTYAITDSDVAGPFAERIPSDLVEQAKLPALAYTSAIEALAERFHTTPAFLKRLNPQATFAAGEQIQVPNVEPLAAPAQTPDVPAEAQTAAKNGARGRATGTSGTRGRTNRSNAANALAQRPDVVVTVTKRTSALTVADASGKIIFFAPVTTGSEHDPLPIGEWKVNGIQLNPTFNYNPDLFWDADPAHSKAKIPAGPNNPVGLVWIDISKEHYGIHGTPEPAAIGRTQSHGCVRLTNWDALKVAGLVKPGTKVIFAE